MLVVGVGGVKADSYVKYTGQITEGEYIVCYNVYAMKAEVSSDRLVSVKGYNTNQDKQTVTDASLVWIIKKQGDYYTLYNSSVEKYAASTGAKNKAKLETSIGDNTLWTITGTSTYEFVNKKNKDNNVNCNLRLNDGYGFACYATATGGALTLYKKVENSTTLPTTTTIDATGITNTDVYTNKAAGQLTATVSAKGTDISGATVTWESSSQNVATIDASGNVTLVAAGTTTITATYAGVDGQYEGSSATYTLTVTDSTPFTGGDVTFVAGTDLGTTTGNGTADEVSKSVVTISGTDAAFATAEYRFYANSTTTFSVPEGYYITKIIFTDADTKNPCSNLARKNGTAGEFDSETLTWTGASSTVVFVASAQARASQIVVNVAKGTLKQSPNVEISDTELEVNGEVVTATVTTNGPAVTLSTSDPAVASVSGTTVTAVAAGTATITATWEENDTYVGGTKAFTVTVTDNTPVTTDWVKTELSALTADDIFVIVGNNENDYALANDKGTGSAPTAVSVTVSGNYLTGTVADNIKWHVSGNATDGYTFYPNGSTTTWLYCTNTNNGVRVGTGEAKAFTQTTNSYLTTTQTTDQRYLGIYNSQDWRCYTSEGGNIADQTFAFYKYTGAPAPSITADAVEIAFDATSGSISYTINNGVEGGTLAATTEADWLTIGTVGENVPFTTTANETALARTADVVLTYAYGTSTTSNTITVTQAGNPSAPGTVNNPYTVAEALEVIEALADNGKTSDVYVKGTISSISEVSTEHGNATYFISGGTSELYVFRGYFLENAKFTAEDQIQVGDEVVVYGKLQKYVKDGNTTPEVTQGNYIVSLDRPEPVVLSAPIIFHDAGVYEDALTVAMAGEGTIKYTLNGGAKQTYTEPITIDATTTITAWTEQDGAKSDEVSKTFTINKTEKPDINLNGYFSIQNNGNGKYVNVAGRKTVTFVGDNIDKAGTVIKVETEKAKVKVLRSQGVDVPGYADKAMRYVPKIVQLVAEKLGAEGEGNLLGKDGLDAIMKKFNESFDYHLYLEKAGDGYRIYGRTPSMKPVVDFYAENKANVDAKLPQLEQFINDAIKKVLAKTNGSGQSILVPFSLKTVWENMDGTLTEPVDEASTARFYEEVLSSETNVWNFAYETAMIYWTKLKNHKKFEEYRNKLGDYAKYIDKVENIRPNFRYYIVQKNGEMDVISEGNEDIVKNNANTIWTLEDRTEFSVAFNEENVLNNKYYTTLYTDFAYTLPEGEGVKAYKVTKVSEAGVAVKVEMKGIIPAQTPVLLESESKENQTLILSTEDGTAPTDNLLAGADKLIKEYQIKTAQVKALFDMAKEILGENTYNNYVKEYEHLMLRYAGTVNNKYFFGLSQNDMKGMENVRMLNLNDAGENLGFYSNWVSLEANKALIIDSNDPVKLMLKGDVNRDGSITIADVTALVNIILGKAAYPADADKYDFDAAHVNADEEITIADVTALVNIILGK